MDTSTKLNQLVAQIEVAIAALDKIIELEPQDRPPVKGVEVMA